MSNGKNNTVTYVKAIGITLMVLAHAMTPLTIGWKTIYAFHMPLFFLMSGFCFKENYLNNAKQFLTRKIQGIYIPFVAFSLVFLALHNVFCSWYFYEPDWLYGWREFARNAVRIVTRMSHNEGLLGTFWFLKELFWGSLIFYTIMRIWKGNLIGVVVSILGLAELLCITKISVPYFTITYNSFYAAFFIAVGYLWRVKSEREVRNDEDKKFAIRKKWWLYVVGIGAIVVELLYSHHIDIKGNTPISMIYYAIPAIGATMMLYYGCRWMESRLPDAIGKFMRFVGNQSMSIMALHFTTFKLVSLGYIRLQGLDTERLVEFPVMRSCANAGGGRIIVYIRRDLHPLGFCLAVATCMVECRNCKV